MALVVLERSLETTAEGDAILSRRNPCLALYNVEFLGSYVSPDRRRMVCLYEAPDAESVRQANRQAGKSFVRAWAADVFERHSD